MSIVYMSQSKDRAAFVGTVFEKLQIREAVAGKRILLKPNIVSHEPYPTTTHPEMIQVCYELLKDAAETIVAADGPAWDAGDSDTIINEHPLKQTCDAQGIVLANLMSKGSRKIGTRSYELEVAQMVFEYDFILSLPVLKSHGMGLTGAIKNQFGLVQTDDKLRSHRTRDMNVVLAELNEKIKPDLFIVDAVQTLIDTNEVRHGGRPHDLGYLLAGTDPVSLDAAGLEFLKRVEPKLEGKHPRDLPQLKHAADLGVGETEYEIIEL